MKTIRVLIVEDDARIADLHRRFTMRVEGCEVVGVAHSLEDARDMVEVLEPDLLLLDLYFPEGHGMDLLLHIRSKCLDTDVILITAAREIEPVKQALRGGVYDYLIKPVIATRFFDCLSRYRNYRTRLSCPEDIGQQDVDNIFHPATPGNMHADADDNLPKGIDPLTLRKFLGVFESMDPDQGLSAEGAGQMVGVSRSTARRYLEYLVSTGVVYADLVYGSIGRPERMYFGTRPTVV